MESLPAENRASKFLFPALARRHRKQLNAQPQSSELLYHQQMHEVYLYEAYRVLFSELQSSILKISKNQICKSLIKAYTVFIRKNPDNEQEETKTDAVLIYPAVFEGLTSRCAPQLSGDGTGEMAASHSIKEEEQAPLRTPPKEKAEPAGLAGEQSRLKDTAAAEPRGALTVTGQASLQDIWQALQGVPTPFILFGPDLSGIFRLSSSSSTSSAIEPQHSPSPTPASTVIEKKGILFSADVAVCVGLDFLLEGIAEPACVGLFLESQG